MRGHGQDAGSSCSTTWPTDPGLLGLSGGLSNDLRDIEEQAGKGNQQARLAHRCIRRRGAALSRRLSGAPGRRRRHRLHRRHRRKLGRDAGGRLRQPRLVRHRLDPTRTERDRVSRRFTPPDSRVAIWIMPTNEELIVARQAQAVAGVVRPDHVPGQSHRQRGGDPEGRRP